MRLRGCGDAVWGEGEGGVGCVGGWSACPASEWRDARWVQVQGAGATGAAEITAWTLSPWRMCVCRRVWRGGTHPHGRPGRAVVGRVDLLPHGLGQLVTVLLVWGWGSGNG